MFWRKVLTFSQQWLWSVRSSGHNGVFFDRSPPFVSEECTACCLFFFHGMFLDLLFNPEGDDMFPWNVSEPHSITIQTVLVESFYVHLLLEENQMHLGCRIHSGEYSNSVLLSCDTVVLLVDTIVSEATSFSETFIFVDVATWCHKPDTTVWIQRTVSCFKI